MIMMQSCVSGLGSLNDTCSDSGQITHNDLGHKFKVTSRTLRRVLTDRDRREICLYHQSTEARQKDIAGNLQLSFVPYRKAIAG